MHIPTKKAFKTEAKKLANTKKIKYMKALDQIAVKYGLKNWNIAKTKLVPEEEGIDRDSVPGKKILAKIEVLLHEIQDEQTEIGNYMQESSQKSVDASNDCLRMIAEKEYTILFLNYLLSSPVEIDLPTKDKMEFFTDVTLSQPEQKKLISHADSFKIRIERQWEYGISMKDNNQKDFTDFDKEKVIENFNKIADAGRWKHFYKQEWIIHPGKKTPVMGERTLLDTNSPEEAEYWVWGCIDGEEIETFGGSFETVEGANTFRDHLRSNPENLKEYAEGDINRFTSIETRYQRK